MVLVFITWTSVQPPQNIHVLVYAHCDMIISPSFGTAKIGLQEYNQALWPKACHHEGIAWHHVLRTFGLERRVDRSELSWVFDDPCLPPECLQELPPQQEPTCNATVRHRLPQGTHDISQLQARKHRKIEPSRCAHSLTTKCHHIESHSCLLEGQVCLLASVWQEFSILHHRNWSCTDRRQTDQSVGLHV